MKSESLATLLKRKAIFWPLRFWYRLYIHLDEHMRELVRGSFIAFILQFIGAGLGFALNVLLARFLGAEGTGIYYLAFTIITIAATLGRFGLDNSLIRFIASNSTMGSWSAVKGVYIKGMLYAFICSFILTLLIGFLAPWMAEAFFSKSNLVGPLRLMSLAIIPFAIFVLHANALKGIKHISGAVSIQNVWVWLFATLGVIILAPAWGVIGAVCAYTISAFITMLLSIWLWQKATPQLKGISAHFEARELLQSSIPLFWVVVSNLVITWSSILLLGIWTDSDSVGIFSVASRSAFLMVFFLRAVNSIAAPKFAAAYQQNDLLALEDIARNSAKFLMLMTSPLLFVFLVIPDLVMQVFGHEFIEGASVLSILSIGQFINVSTGSVGYLLMMSGHEKLMRNISAFCAALNIILNVILIPRIGIAGAATATASTLALENIIAFILVWIKLRIITLPFVPKHIFVKRSSR